MVKTPSKRNLPSGKPRKPADEGFQTPSWVDAVSNDAKPHLLLVDDDDLILKTLELRFSRTGFDVTTLHAGSDALHSLSQLGQALETIRPNAVITDFDMVDFDGKDLMHEAKRLYPKLPVYLLSGNDGAQRDARMPTPGAMFDGIADKADIISAVPAIVDMLSKRGIVPTKTERLPGS